MWWPRTDAGGVCDAVSLPSASLAQPRRLNLERVVGSNHQLDGNEVHMSNPNMDDTTGRIKQAIGDLTDHNGLKREGAGGRTVGTLAQGLIGQVRSRNRL